MGHKVHPLSYRLGFIVPWQAKWFGHKNIRDLLSQDETLRNFILKVLTDAGITKIEVNRAANEVILNIYTSRPGVIIGRGGTGIEDIKKKIQRKLGPKTAVKINIKEIAKPQHSASILAQSIAEQLEKRIPFRRTIKQVMDKAKEAGVKGIKIMVSGRLDGQDMSRKEWLAWGEIPLGTLRADIDFAKVDAHTPVGLVGVKVWIYLGEKFDLGPEELSQDDADKPGLAQPQKPKSNNK